MCIRDRLIPDTLDHFVGLVEKKIKDGKPTIAQTDERLKYITISGDDDALRRAHQEACHDHPDVVKYIVAYEKWESRKRPMAVIDLYENTLAEAEASNDGEAITKLRAKLSALWIAANHFPNAMKHWVAADEAKKKEFERKEKNRAEIQEAESGEEGNQDGTKTTLAQKTPIRRQPNAAKKKTFEQTIGGVKKAIDAEDFEAARQVLRKIWRKTRSTVASSYAPPLNRAVNALTWPASPSKSNANKSVAQNKAEVVEAQPAAAERSKRIARGGLAAFTPAQRAAPKASVSAWEKLAEYPFAVEEMELITRVYSAPVNGRPGNASVEKISLGLLKAARNQNGDKATFESLIEQIRIGHLSNRVVGQFLEMVKDGQNLDNDELPAVVEVLLNRLDLTDIGRATDMANLCAKIGQHKRATGLFRHCVLLKPKELGGFVGLLAQAKKHYEGEELMELAESMFELSGQTPEGVSQLLELRLETLSPKVAADRSRSLFDGEISATSTAELQKIVSAVPVFARSGDHDLAAKCLASVLSHNGNPAVSTNPSYSYVNPSSRRLLQVSRNHLIRMFPADTSQYRGNEKWLAAASAAVSKCSDDKDISLDLIVETLLTIAIRQCENSDLKGAAETLSRIDGQWISETPQHQLLAIDVMRLAGQTEQALQLATKLYEQRRLTQLRFGDLLRDKKKVDGLDAAMQLFSELTDLSMDQDLLEAAAEIAEKDQASLELVTEIQAAQAKAKSEYEVRRLAAKKRSETMKRWQQEDSKKLKAKKAASTNASP